MVRSAAKNHARVAVVCDPADYDARARRARADGRGDARDASASSPPRRSRTPPRTTRAISGYLSSLATSDGGRGRASRGTSRCRSSARTALRYGENPHQTGAFYVERDAPAGSLARAESLGAGGKELSLQQPRRRRRRARGRSRVRAAGRGRRQAHQPVRRRRRRRRSPTAYRAAREADALSAFGGIVALNREVDEPTAKVLAETFLECVVAPVVRAGGARGAAREEEPAPPRDRRAGSRADHAALTCKRVGGGLVVQDRDATGRGRGRRAARS